MWQAASYPKTPVLESLFNSEYCENFQSTYFEEHLQTAASENVFLRIFIKSIHKFHIKNRRETRNFSGQWRFLKIRALR